MEPDAKETVRRVVRSYLEREAPDQLAELDIAFDAVYRSVLNRLDEQEPQASDGGDTRLPFGPEIVAASLIFAAVAITALYLREASGSKSTGEAIRRFDKLEARFAASVKLQRIALGVRMELTGTLEPTAGIRRQGGDGSAPGKPKQHPRPLPARQEPAVDNRASGIDLEIRVTIRGNGGHRRLHYVLHSPNGSAGFHHREISGPKLLRDPDDFRGRLMKKLEELDRGLDVDRAMLFKDEVERKLEAAGHGLYEELFPPEMRLAYRGFRDRVTTLRITSQEPWIPWELIRPYDEDGGEVIDDDFLGARFQLTRWLAGEATPPETIAVKRMLCIEAGSAHGLPCACEEAEEIRRLAEELGVESQVLPQITAAELEDLLRRGGVDWLHVISHGKFDAAAPEESRLVLCDGRNLRPGDLHGRIRTQIRRDRPLVFLNACQSGQQGFSLTGLGGWAAAWVADCRCAAFIGPQWAVRDDLARTFATVLYRQLARGATLGRATLAARLATRDQEPGCPVWLAFQVYGHPGAVLAHTLGLP